MTTTNKAAKAQRVADRALTQFSVLAWRAEVTEAASDLMSASQRVLQLMLNARGKVETDTAREAVQDAFATAYSALQGCTFEEAKSAKSVKNRVADAMAIFKAVVLPSALPKNLQHAATECRKANRAEQAPKMPTPPANDGGEGGDDTGDGAQGEHVAPDPIGNALATMQNVLNALRQGEHSDDVLLIIANMADMVEELSNALADEVEGFEEPTTVGDDVPESDAA